MAVSPVRESVRTLLFSAGALFGSGAFASVAALVAGLLAAREFGPAAYGAVAVAQAYGLIIARLIGFQAWQWLISASTERDAAASSELRNQRIRLSWAVDYCSAIVVLILSLSLIPIAKSVLGFDQAALLAIFACTAPANVLTTGAGVFRLFGRFNEIAVQRALIAASRLFAIILVVSMNWGVYAYALVVAIGDVAPSLVLTLRSRIVAPSSMPGMLSAVRGLRRHSDRRMWRFLVITNLHSIVKSVLRDGDSLLIGAVAGHVGAGFYRLAKQFGAGMMQLSDPLYQVIYPSLGRAFGSGELEEARRNVVQLTQFAGFVSLAIWLGVVMFGRPLLTTVLGPEYLEAYHVIVLYTLGAAIAVVTFAFHPVLLAAQRPGVSFRVLLAASVVYLPTAVYMTHRLGATGAAAAFVVFYVVWALLMMRIAVPLLRGANVG